MLAGQRTKTRGAKHEFRNMDPQEFYRTDAILKVKLGSEDKQWSCRSPGGWEGVLNSFSPGKAGLVASPEPWPIGAGSR